MSLRAVNLSGRTLAAAGMAALLTALGACQSGGPTAKERARQSWNDERAALKYELASAELTTGRADKAVSLAREAVGLSPDRPGHAELLARAYMAEGDFASARNVLLSVQASHPEFAPAAYLLGAVYEREQRWPRAIEAYGRAVEAAPEELDYRIALAQAVAQTGEHVAARGVLDDGRERFASDPKFHLAYAAICRRAGDLPAACAAYEAVLRLGVDDPEVRTALGLCLYWSGRWREGFDYLDALVRADGEPETAVMAAYAGSLLRTGEARHAAEWLGRFTAQRPDVGQLWLLLAQARSTLGETEAADAAVRQALRLEPNSADALVMAATLHLAAGQLDEAAQAIQHALRVDPDNVEGLLLYGRVCERRGDCRAAAEAYQAAWELDQSELVADLLARVTAGD